MARTLLYFLFESVYKIVVRLGRVGGEGDTTRRDVGKPY